VGKSIKKKVEISVQNFLSRGREDLYVLVDRTEQDEIRIRILPQNSRCRRPDEVVQLELDMLARSIEIRCGIRPCRLPVEPPAIGAFVLRRII
jgi:hypothetical protein